MNSFLRNLFALVRKEFKHLIRDPSNLLLGIGLPVILIFIFGYGITFEITSVNVGIVNYSNSEYTHNIVQGIEGSPYFILRTYHSPTEALEGMQNREVEAYLFFDNNFSKELASGNGNIDLMIDGKDSSRAQTIANSLGKIIQTSSQKNLTTGYQGVKTSTKLNVMTRLMYNETDNSSWYIVPGLITLIITLIGTFLTSLVMAREYESGTMEGLFVTPIRPLEIIIGKIIPYFIIGLCGLTICMIAANVLFNLPVRGNLFLIYCVSMIYLVVTLCMGLTISAITKNQFIASQLSLITSFMPCVMLSGFIFDLRNAPVWINVIGHLLPSTYYLELIKTMYLVGDYYPLILRNGVILLVYMLIFIFTTLRYVKKNLD